jgi:hypothetical protein
VTVSTPGPRAGDSGSGASPGSASSVSAAVLTPEQLASLTGWSFAVWSEQAASHALLVPGAAFLGSATGSLGLQPRFNFRGPGGMRLVASAAASLSFEYTPPNAPTGRRLDWSDLRLSLSAPVVVREPRTGLGVTPSVSLTLPTSLPSLFSNTLAVLGAGVSLNRNLQEGRWVLTYGLSGSRGLHARAEGGPAPGAALPRDPEGVPLFLCRAGAESCAGLGLNSPWMLSNRLGALFLPSERWFLSAGASLAHVWSYAAAEAADPFTSPHARPGMGRSDLLSLSAGAGLNLSAQWSLSAGFSFAGLPLSRDQRTLSVLEPAAWLRAAGYSLSVSALY